VADGSPARRGLVLAGVGAAAHGVGGHAAAVEGVGLPAARGAALHLLAAGAWLGAAALAAAAPGRGARWGGRGCATS